MICVDFCFFLAILILSQRFGWKYKYLIWEFGTKPKRQTGSQPKLAWIYFLFMSKRRFRDKICYKNLHLNLKMEMIVQYRGENHRHPKIKVKKLSNILVHCHCWISKWSSVLWLSSVSIHARQCWVMLPVRWWMVSLGMSSQIRTRALLSTRTASGEACIPNESKHSVLVVFYCLDLTLQPNIFLLDTASGAVWKSAKGAL